MTVNDVVQFTEWHQWCGCLGIITEDKRKGQARRYTIGVPIPQQGTAYIFDDGSNIKYIGKAVMVEAEEDNYYHLTDTNVGNIEYIRKQDAVELCNNTLSKQSMWLVPSVDVAPVVHGKWMPQKGGGLCCSECNGYALDEPDGNFIHVAVSSKFCPHCGAKMDGEE